MAKATEKEMIERVGKYLVTYLRSGVRLDPFTKKIDPVLNIRDVERLLRMHFVLRKDVIDFVQALPDRVRRIRTTVEKHPERVKGGIRGKIDWQATVQERCTKSPGDRTAFIQNLIERNYNTPENMVLRELLSVIHSIVFTDLEPAFERQYKWLEMWWNDKERMRKTVRYTFLKNIYIRRIQPNPGAGKGNGITERMLARTLRSRNPLYREAAALLLSYRRLMNYELDKAEAKELLTNTFIRTEKAELLFELYWTFRVIQAMTHEKENVRFYLIDSSSEQGKNNPVAEWDDREYHYKIFHDSIGSLNFQESLPKSEDIKNIENQFLKREITALKKTQELGSEWFDIDTTDTLWGGRPDIIVERYPEGSKTPDRIFIGEVKYTENPNYALQGLRELLEYMALVKKGEEGYFVGAENNENSDENEQEINIFSSSKLKGWLFVDAGILLGRQTQTFKEQNSISVVKFPGDKIPV